MVEGVDFIFRGIRVENLGFLFDSNAIVGEIFSFVKFWCFNLLIEDDVLWKVVNFICDNWYKLCSSIFEYSKYMINGSFYNINIISFNYIINNIVIYYYYKVDKVVIVFMIVILYIRLGNWGEVT